MASGESTVMDEGQMPSMAVTFPGPFSAHDVVVNGWRVPLVRAHVLDEDRVQLVLDDRLMAEFSTDEAERVVPFLADAIAIALGYPSHPNGDREPARAPLPRPARTMSIVQVEPQGEPA